MTIPREATGAGALAVNASDFPFRTTGIAQRATIADHKQSYKNG